MPFYYYYGTDTILLVLILAAAVLSIFAQMRVSSTFKKYSNVLSSRQITGKEAAEMMLSRKGIVGVSVLSTAGNLTDHYDPRNNVIKLSEGVYNSRSVAAIGVACHEAGHAVQHAEQHLGIKIRDAVLPVASIGSKAAIPLVILGIIFSLLELAMVGVILFAAVFIFQVITLPVEFGASKIALQSISEMGILTDSERVGSRKVLSAAALTYVAAAIVSLLNLLRLLAMVRRR